MTDPPELSAALVAALGNLDELHRDKRATVPTKAGGTYTYTYTDLASVLGYVRPILAAEGLAVMQPVTAEVRNDQTVVSVATSILHRSGQCRDFPPLSMPAGRTPQEVGSAISYARRYSLLAALGLATEDDDGKAASKPPAKPRASTAARVAAAPSAAMTRRVMAQFGKLGITERDERLKITGGIIGRDVDTWNDCTADEARIVTEALDGRLDALGNLDQAGA